MYPGGAAERGGRHRGRARPARERGAAAISATRSTRSPKSWQRLPTRMGRGRTDGDGRVHGARHGAVRLQELEVHHVDLDVGYLPTDWPVAFVGHALDRTLRTLPDRATADRPEMDARYRIEATDHGRAWTVILHGIATSRSRATPMTTRTTASRTRSSAAGAATCSRGCSVGTRCGHRDRVGQRRVRAAAVSPGSGRRRRARRRLRATTIAFSLLAGAVRLRDSLRPCRRCR